MWSLDGQEHPDKRKRPRKRAARLQINAISMPILPCPAADGKADQKQCTNIVHTA